MGFDERMAKEASVLVLDVGRTMTADDLEMGKTALRVMLQQKLLFTKRDEMGLVLLGTAGTGVVRKVVLS